MNALQARGHLFSRSRWDLLISDRDIYIYIYI